MDQTFLNACTLLKKINVSYDKAISRVIDGDVSAVSELAELAEASIAAWRVVKELGSKYMLK